MTFDAPNANVTCTRRARSNTPTQALTLANDHAFVELAQGLAARVMREAPDDIAGRVEYVFRLCMGRQPNNRETERLAQFLREQLRQFAASPDDADLLAPEGRLNNATAADAAALTALSRVLMNLDEFITRE